MRTGLSIILILLFLNGCVVTPAQTTENAIPNSIASRLLLRGNLLYLKVNDLRAQKKNRFLMVEAEILNTRTFDDTVYYRFKWFDSNGFQLSGDEAWKTLALKGEQVQRISGVATSQDAADFKLELQSPNNRGN
jgi:uncharacterized protein YcfL